MHLKQINSKPLYHVLWLHLVAKRCKTHVKRRSIHLFFFLMTVYPAPRATGFQDPIPIILRQRRGTPWPSRRFVAGSLWRKCECEQPFALTFASKGNSELPPHLICICLDLGGKGPDTRTHRGDIETPPKKGRVSSKACHTMHHNIHTLQT